MAKLIHKFGRNNDVGNGTWEDVWMNGGAYPFPTAAGKVTIRSSTQADTSTGAGARSVTVAGLSSAWDDLSETIATNGTGRVVSSNKFTRVFRAYVEEAGTYSQLFTGGNRGTILIRTTSSGTLANILASTGGGTVGFGQTQMAIYTVPAGWVGYVTSAIISAKTAKAVDVAFFQRRNADDTVAPMKARRLVEYYDGVAGQISVNHETPLGPFPAKTDLWWAAKGDGVASAVSVNFDILMFPTGQAPEFNQ